MQDDGFQREWQQHSVLFLRALSLGTIPKSSFEQVLQFLRSACHDAQCPDFFWSLSYRVLMCSVFWTPVKESSIKRVVVKLDHETFEFWAYIQSGNVLDCKALSSIFEFAPRS